MLEQYWILVPNIIASIFLMLNKSFYSNLVFCIGYPIMIWHNMQINDSTQIQYFMLLEIMSIIGVISYSYKKWVVDKNDR